MNIRECMTQLTSMIHVFQNRFVLISSNSVTEATRSSVARNSVLMGNVVNVFIIQFFHFLFLVLELG